MNGILAATLMVGGTGLLIGILLGIAGKKFYVEVDERETKVREALPGNNCDGCSGRRSYHGTKSRCTGAQKSSGTVRRYV